MTSMEKIEQRAVIKHCVRAGMTPVNTLKFMNAGKTCKLGLVYKWHARFRLDEKLHTMTVTDGQKLQKG